MDKVSNVKQIMAVVTLRTGEQVAYGVPCFYVTDKKEQDHVSFLLGRLMDGVPADLGNGTFVIVKH